MKNVVAVSVATLVLAGIAFLILRDPGIGAQVDAPPLLDTESANVPRSSLGLQADAQPASRVANGPASLPAAQVSHPLTIGEYLSERHPDVDFSQLPISGRLGEPVGELLEWEEVREAAEDGMMSDFVNSVDLAGEEMLERAFFGAVGAGSVRSWLSDEALRRGITLDARQMDSLIDDAVMRGGGIEQAQRRIEQAKLNVVARKVYDGEYDSFPFVSIPELAKHSGVGAGTVGISFYSGQGWVSQVSINADELLDGAALQADKEAAITDLLDSLL